MLFQWIYSVIDYYADLYSRAEVFCSTEGAVCFVVAFLMLGKCLMRSAKKDAKCAE